MMGRFIKLRAKLKQQSKKASDLRRPGASRKKPKPQYRTLRMHRKIRAKDFKPLPSAWVLWKSSLSFMWTNRRPLGLFILIYSILYILFVRGLSGGINLGELREILKEDSSTATGVITSVTLLSVLLSTSNATTSQVASLYQTILIVLGSLAIIWLLRQLSGDRPKKVRVRDAFYKGMGPLVPFLIVLTIIVLEFIPLTVGSFILNISESNGLAGSGLEQIAVISITVLLALLSFYLVSGSLAAIYIVTLPDITPLRALRASHELLGLHRWSVVRKLIVLGFLLLIAAMIIFLPLLFFLPSGLAWITEYVFFACSILAFAVFHTYLYSLYKSLL